MNPEPLSRSLGPHPKKTDRRRRGLGMPALLPVLPLTVVVIGATCCKRSPAAAPLPVPTVRVAVATATNVPLTIEFIGQLDSPQNVEVRARVEGFLDETLFAEGRGVRKGDLLFVLDRKPFQERLAAANGSLAEARAALNKYEKDVARLRPLAEKRAIPQQDLDNALASVEIGKANVLSAESRVASATLDLSYCEVRAPVSGLIGARQVAVGSLVGRGQPTLLATISTLDPMWFYCTVSEVEYLSSERHARERGRRLDDLPVTLILSDGSEFAERGKWVFLDRAVDVGTGTLRLRAEFPNPSYLLRPGMFARARMSIQSDQDRIVIPQRAVQELQGRSYVWVVAPDNKALQQWVKVGPRIGSGWVIEEGLKPGDRLIVEGVQKARHGAPVQPEPFTPNPRAADATPKSAKE